MEGLRSLEKEHAWSRYNEGYGTTSNGLDVRYDVSTWSEEGTRGPMVWSPIGWTDREAIRRHISNLHSQWRQRCVDRP